jgi:hypothetical protein
MACPDHRPKTTEADHRAAEAPGAEARSYCVRRAFAILLVLALVVGVYLVTRGLGGGLVPVDEESASFEVHCDEVAAWEAALIRNTAKSPAVITAVRLDAPPRAFSLAYARAWYGPRAVSADDGRARTKLVGLRIAHARASVNRVWHVMIGVRMPHCSAPGNPRGWTWGLRARKSVAVSYRVDGEERSVRLGGKTVMCAAARGKHCVPPPG